MSLRDTWREMIIVIYEHLLNAQFVLCRGTICEAALYTAVLLYEVVIVNSCFYTNVKIVYGYCKIPL